jgi:hypothetical protein
MHWNYRHTTGARQQRAAQARYVRHPVSVRSIWLRHALANFKQRLKAIEQHVAATSAVLTEAQVIAL